MPFNTWDTKNKLWTIPYSEKLLSDLKNAAAAQGFKILYEEEEKSEVRARRISPFDIANYRTCPEEYTNKLKELRYSKNTAKTYKGLFEEFINYYLKFDIDQIDEKMIKEFLQYLVIERKILSSNWQAIGYIKAAVLSNSPKQYSFTDKNLQSGKYQYRLKMIDND